VEPSTPNFAIKGSSDGSQWVGITCHGIVELANSRNIPKAQGFIFLIAAQQLKERELHDLIFQKVGRELARNAFLTAVV
jgi:hypothetical protein